MSEPEALVEAVASILSGPATPAVIRDITPGRPAALSGRHVVITAGPTREAIDPVRYICNHSSGKQGYALATAALAIGARVTLISGPVAEPIPAGATMIPVVSANDMLAASLLAAADCDLFIAVAAVADYRPATPADRKIKKRASGNGRLNLDLVENPDIVASVAALPNRPVVVGFAAETHDALPHARAKLEKKGLDAIIVNDVSRSDIGFGSDDNAATLIWRDGELSLEKQSKAMLAREIIDRLAALFVRQLAHTNPENVAN
jgi:phosphopantothenoylcysteine decarboxylase/phosphopantothenate--cysteine ligase